MQIRKWLTSCWWSWRAVSRHLPKLVLVSGVVAASSVAHAGITAAQAEVVMKKSGLWDQLGSVLPQARVGFSAAFSLAEGDPPNDEADRLNEALEAAYGAERLRQLGMSRVARAMEPRQAATLMRWFESPLGRKVSQVEQAASTTQTDLREVIRQGSGVFEQLPEGRRALLAQLLAQTRAGEAMVEVSLHTLVATHKGVSAALAGGSRLTNDEVKATLTAERAQMLKAYERLILASFAQAYGPLTDDELRGYVAFLKSPAGRHHTELAARTLTMALEDGASVFIQRAPLAVKAAPASAR